MISHLRDAVNVLIIMAIGLLVGCKGTETTNPPGGEITTGLVGRLVDGNGRIVKGASVRALAVGNNPLAKANALQGIVDSVATDGKGEYHFGALPAGTYNLIGDYQHGSLVVLIPKQYFAGGATKLDIGTDTLRLPGQIRGAVEVDGIGKGNIFCYLPGTSILSISDEMGKVWITGIPKGRYTVNYSYPGFQTSTDTGVIVNSNETTTLAPHALTYDSTFPPPSPKNLSAVYDTLSGVVTLHWNMPKITNLDGFVIYRVDSITSNSVRINQALVRDTLYQDTVYRNAKDTSKFAFTYQVKSQDRGANLSLGYSSSAVIKTIAPSAIQTKISFSQETPFITTAVMNDTIRLLAQYENPLRLHKRIAWYQEGNAKGIREVKGNIAEKGVDTLIWVWHEPGKFSIKVVFEDSTGQEWTKALALTVLEDAPIAKATRELDIKVGNPTVFTGTGNDLYGRIVKFAWDFNADGQFDDSSLTTGNITRTFSAPGFHHYVFRVTDDDGNSSYDTLKFDVGITIATDTLKNGFTYTKSGGPYLLSKMIQVPTGVTVTVEPGTFFRVQPGGGFLIRGTFICAGLATDSIRFESEYISPESPENGGLKFDGAPSSIVKDSTHIFGSHLRFVSFKHTYGVQIVNSLITIEDCNFDGQRPKDDTGGVAGSIYISPDQTKKSNWIFRRNHLIGVNLPGLEIDVMQKVQSKVSLLINDNVMKRNGIAFTLSTSGIEEAFLVRNEFVEDTNGTGPGYGLSIWSGKTLGVTPFQIQNNLFTGFSTAAYIKGPIQSHFENNDFKYNATNLQVEGHSGTFRLNYVRDGSIWVKTENGFYQPDSNFFGPEATISNLNNDPRSNLRNNYWSTQDTKLILTRIYLSSLQNSPIPEQATDATLIIPILKAPPTGAGRREKPAF